MHNAAIAALGLHYTYIPFAVRPESIGPAIRSLPILGIVGVNLTIPHKERVLPHLDVVAPEAAAVGAVNTVHVVDGRLVGHNTDGEGFLRPLNARGFSPRGARVVVLGAGGAARAVAHRLAREGARVLLANRTRERAESLANHVRASAPEASVEVLGLEDRRALGEEIAAAGLLVNTTSVGMHPREEELPPIPLQALHPGLLVCDLIYNPQETRLLAEARKAGAVTLNGIPMLVEQGAAAFRIWTGVQPPTDIMEEAVRSALSGC